MMRPESTPAVTPVVNMTVDTRECVRTRTDVRSCKRATRPDAGSGKCAAEVASGKAAAHMTAKAPAHMTAKAPAHVTAEASAHMTAAAVSAAAVSAAPAAARERLG
jgi:hypothetical protein